MFETSLNVRTASGTIKLQTSPSKPLFVLGRNGTGKSALIHDFVKQLSGRAIYIPGARPSYFDQENLAMTPASRKTLTTNFRAWDATPDTRWKAIQGTARNERAIHDLTIAETQFKVDAANEISRDGKDSVAVARLQARTSPIDRVNAILRQGNLPITVVIESGELRANRDQHSYSIAKMSDGERIALVLIAEVVAAPVQSIFIIDEPELHLHRSIVAPLINSIMLENSESSFIVSTHELDLLLSCPHSSIAVLRGCVWTNADITQWQIDEISSASDIAEGVRVEILGSRQKLLFVEGDNTSLDRPLYALLFPNASVRPRESCREVERAVTGLLATKDLHHTEVFGMVDGDGMSHDEMEEFRLKNVYSLPVHSVESLYYADEVLFSIAQRQAETFGEDSTALLNEARSSALASLNSEESVSHLASKVAERRLRDAMLRNLPSRADLVNGRAQMITVNLPSTFPTELTQLKSLRSTQSLSEIISRYPVRESSLLKELATGLKFPDRKSYEKAVLQRLTVDEELCNVLRSKLGELAQKLM